MALITSCCDAMRNHEHQMALITSHAPGLTDPGHAGARLALRARQVLGARPSPPRTLVFRPAEHLFQTPVRFLCPASCSSPLLSLSLSPPPPPLLSLPPSLLSSPLSLLFLLSLLCCAILLLLPLPLSSQVFKHFFRHLFTGLQHRPLNQVLARLLCVHRRA